MTDHSDQDGWCAIDGGDNGQIRCRCGGELTPPLSEVRDPNDATEVRCAATGQVVGNYRCEGHCSARIWWSENPHLDPDYETDRDRGFWRSGSNDYDPLSPLSAHDTLAIHWDQAEARFSVPGSEFTRGRVLAGGEWDADHQACWVGVPSVEVLGADPEGRWIGGDYGREATVSPG